MLTLKLKDIKIGDEVKFTRRIAFWKQNKPPKELESHIEQIKNYCQTNNLEIVSANEIGINKRIIYIDKPTLDISNIISNTGLVLINPTIIKSEGKAIVKEATNIDQDTLVAYVTRPYRITIAYTTIEGNKETITLEGINVALFCQKYHLLDGISPKDMGKNVQEKETPDLLANSSQDDDYKKETESGENKLKITYKIADMGKGCCTDQLIRTINNIPGVYGCYFNIFTRTITVEVSSTIMSIQQSLVEKTNLLKKIRKEIESFEDERTKYKITATTYDLVGTESIDKKSAILGARTQNGIKPIITIDNQRLGEVHSRQRQRP